MVLQDLAKVVCVLVMPFLKEGVFEEIAERFLVKREQEGNANEV